MLLLMTLVGLLGGHAVADYGLQSSYMAEHKVRRPDNKDWWVTLSAHCFIHAFMVLIVSMVVLILDLLDAGQLLAGQVEQIAMIAALLALAEFAAHFVIDTAKGQGWMSYQVDQALHWLCKFSWAGVIFASI